MSGPVLLSSHEDRWGATRPLTPYESYDNTRFPDFTQNQQVEQKIKVNQDLMDRMAPHLETDSNLRSWAQHRHDYGNYDEDDSRGLLHSALKSKIRSAIDQWAGTSGDHSFNAWQLQAAAQRHFGLPASTMRYGAACLRGLGDEYTSGEQAYATKSWHQDKPFYDHFIRAVYNNTQDHLRQKYGTNGEVVLHRGVSLHGIYSLPDYRPSSQKSQEFLEYHRHLGPAVSKIEKRGNLYVANFRGTDGSGGYQYGQPYTHHNYMFKDRSGSVQSNPLTSWSQSSNVADMFGVSDLKTMLSHRVPISRVASTALTGFGCLDEHEHCLIGGTHHVLLKTPDWEALKVAPHMVRRLIANSQDKPGFDPDLKKWENNPELRHWENIESIYRPGRNS